MSLAGTFSRTRLTVARQRAHLTKSDLAGRIGVSVSTISRYEEGDRGPLEKQIQQLAMALGVPAMFLCGLELDFLQAGAPSFRARRSMTLRQRDAALALAIIATDIVAPTFLEHFQLPAVDVPDLSDHTPQVAALLLREQWKLGGGPIGNTIHLLEAKGVWVFWVGEQPGSIDAFSLWRKNHPFVFLNPLKPAGERARFDAAHELGHLVLHAGFSTVGDAKTEREANAFAAEFLMPSDQMRRELPSRPILDLLLRLKPRWGTSVAALVRHGHDIGQYSDWDYTSAFKSISARWGRTTEPGALPREESALLPTILERLATRGKSPYDLAADLNLDFRDLCALVPAAGRPAPDDNQSGADKIRHLRVVE